jgi:putative hemolysin
MPDDVIGILNAKDYFRLENKTRENVMKSAVTPAYFVPDSIKADVLFANMKRRRCTLSVVVDEYGGMVGIITLNDLIEQLVGDLGEDTPEEAAAEPHIEQMDENTWALIGNVELLEIEQTLEVDIGLEEVDTFTGLVFSELDMIPSDGDQDIELDFKGLHIHITRIEDHQIAFAKVSKILPDAQEEEPEE